MFPARREKKRRRAAAVAIEPLEERVALTAGVAYVEIQYLRAISHLSNVLQRRVNQVQTMLTRRTARIDAQFEGAVNHSAARLLTGPAQVALARAGAAAEARINKVVANVGRQLGSFTASFNRQVAGVTDHYGRLNRISRTANPYFQAIFHDALNAVDAGLPAEAQAAQGTLEGAVGPVQSAVAQASTSAAPAEAQAKVAAGRLAAAGAAQTTADRAAVARFWDEYYGSFNPLRAELAAIASAQLPPIHLGGGGAVTGPQGNGAGNRRGIKGPGAGIFTNLPGGGATSGTGFSFGTGVTGTTSIGTGNGTTTITGAGPGVGTTGGGSTGVSPGFGTGGGGSTGPGTTGGGGMGLGTAGGGGTGVSPGFGSGGGGAGLGSTGSGSTGTAGNGLGSTGGTTGTTGSSTTTGTPMI